MTIGKKLTFTVTTTMGCLLGLSIGGLMSGQRMRLVLEETANRAMRRVKLAHETREAAALRSQSNLQSDHGSVAVSRVEASLPSLRAGYAETARLSAEGSAAQAGTSVRAFWWILILIGISIAVGEQFFWWSGSSAGAWSIQFWG